MAEEMERMTQMFMSLMEAKARRKVPENQKKEEASRVTKCLQAMLAKFGQFDGRRATRYLKEYFMEATIHKISEKVAIEEFATLVESELKPFITKFSQEARRSGRPLSKRSKRSFALKIQTELHQQHFLLGCKKRTRSWGRKSYCESSAGATINFLPRTLQQLV
jgi:hypothetical protein